MKIVYYHVVRSLLGKLPTYEKDSFCFNYEVKFVALCCLDSKREKAGKSFPSRRENINHGSAELYWARGVWFIFILAWLFTFIQFIFVRRCCAVKIRIQSLSSEQPAKGILLGSVLSMPLRSIKSENSIKPLIDFIDYVGKNWPSGTSTFMSNAKPSRNWYKRELPNDRNFHPFFRFEGQITFLNIIWKRTRVDCSRIECSSVIPSYHLWSH